jgi:hypothetical protein
MLSEKARKTSTTGMELRMAKASCEKTAELGTAEIRRMMSVRQWKLAAMLAAPRRVRFFIFSIRDRKHTEFLITDRVTALAEDSHQSFQRLSFPSWWLNRREFRPWFVF